MKGREKKRRICCFLTMSAVVLFSSLSVNAKYPEVRAAGSTEQSSVVRKFSYDMVLPEVIPVNNAELERIRGLAEKGVSAAAEEMKTYEDAVLVPVLRELLNIYYADAKNPDMKSINTLIVRIKYVWKLLFCVYRGRACLKIHSRHLHAPLCGIFGPNSGYIARYAPFI